MAKKNGVVLSGCGVMDGSEIHEKDLSAPSIQTSRDWRERCTLRENQSVSSASHLSSPQKYSAAGIRRSLLIS